jgi:hypothetical protein
MKEDKCVQGWDVKRRDDDDETTHNRPEQKLIAPESVEPRATFVNHAVEERSTRIAEDPCKVEECPGEYGVAGCASSEDAFAGRTGFNVAVLAEVAIPDTEHDGDKGADCADCEDYAVDNQIEEELGSEDAMFELNHVSIGR